jgi:hypothetical protein
MPRQASDAEPAVAHFPQAIAVPGDRDILLPWPRGLLLQSACGDESSRFVDRACTSRKLNFQLQRMRLRYTL